MSKVNPNIIRKAILNIRRSTFSNKAVNVMYLINILQGIIQMLLGDEEYKKLLTLAVKDYEHTEVMLSELETILFAYFNVILFKGLINKTIDAKEFKIVTEKMCIRDR